MLSGTFAVLIPVNSVQFGNTGLGAPFFTKFANSRANRARWFACRSVSESFGLAAILHAD
jgi:hypothetical protein